jgi:tRNA nucleotidyltransferase/poly(A) polymerase
LSAMNTNLIISLKQQCPELEQLLAIINQDENDFWFVGGCLRDLVMGQTVNDIDLACDGDPTDLAKKWSRSINVRWFWLDKERLQSRVLLSSSLHVDFSPLRAPSLDEDLELRDFTINSMALSCSEPDRLIDPFNGQEDIDVGCLRPTSARSFPDDPLRMLKGVRHAVTLDMACLPETVTDIRNHAQLITQVSGERIREELIGILTSDDPVSGLDLLWKGGLLSSLFHIEQEEIDGEWWSLLDGLAELCQNLKELERQWAKTIHDLSEKIEFKHLRALYLLVQVVQLLQPSNLSGLLHECLRLSRYEQRLVESLVNLKGHYSQYLSEFNTTTFERTRALVVEQLEPYSLEKMLYISLFDERLLFQQSIDLHRCFSAWQTMGRVPDLISGQQIQKITDCPSGSAIGEWHKKLKQAEINGEIENVDDAEGWLKKQISI